MAELFNKSPFDEAEIVTYGNLLAAMALIQGLAFELAEPCLARSGRFPVPGDHRDKGQKGAQS